VIIDIPPTGAGYALFLKCKTLPAYRIRREHGRVWCETDALSYAAVFGASEARDKVAVLLDGIETTHLLDFQRLLVERALATERFALMAFCGAGKTPMELAFAHAVAKHGRVLYLCPLAVMEQIQRESVRWHGHRLTDLRRREPWTDGIGILNFETRRDIDMTGVSGIVLDEASILKNSDGETRKYLTDLAAGVRFRLAASATPAPNDQAEYASQAVFLGWAGSVKEFWSRFFRKDGTEWVIRGHAREPFYRFLSTWATYIHSPRALGFSGTTELAEEPEYIEARVGVPSGWKAVTERLFQGADAAADRPHVFGGLRSSPGPRIEAIKAFAKDSGARGVIAWALRNEEQTTLARALEEVSGKGSVCVVDGQTEIEARVEAIDAYRSGQLRHIVSKARVLGWGVNLPECDRMVYSGYDYSFEAFYQAVRRAHRFGRQGRLKVLMPCASPELPILESLNGKRATFQADVMELQSRFWGKA
jgi:hypothetical protein